MRAAVGVLVATAWLAACGGGGDDGGGGGGSDGGGGDPADAGGVGGVTLVGATATGGAPYPCDLTEWGVPQATECSDLAVGFTLVNGGAVAVDSFVASFQQPNGWNTYLACGEPIAPGASLVASLTFAFERNPTLEWRCGDVPGMAFVRPQATPVTTDAAASIVVTLMLAGGDDASFTVPVAFDVAP